MTLLQLAQFCTVFTIGWCSAMAAVTGEGISPKIPSIIFVCLELVILYILISFERVK